jgi:hypothetical protein
MSEMLRISFESFPSMRVPVTPAIQAAMLEVEETDDWQPLIDLLYFEFETFFMQEFYIEDVREY